MGQTQFSAGQRSDVQGLVATTVVSVDLGFSQNSESTGVAWQLASGERPPARSFTFGQAVDHVVGLIGNADIAALILEAPLSAQFHADGNPAIRHEFERRFDEEKGKNVSRPWYSGPGAATLLAALFFLRRIREANTKPSRVVLFEGFLTFKSGSTDHAQDANELLDAFNAGRVIDIAKDGSTEWLSVLQLIDSDSNSAIPAIVKIDPTQPESEHKGAD